MAKSQSSPTTNGQWMGHEAAQMSAAYRHLMAPVTAAKAAGKTQRSADEAAKRKAAK